ncbi:MAG: HNH endonuclease [Bacteroidales bacterium]|nr:HNH endonuclease [Bacteroidales bacterium]
MALKTYKPRFISKVPRGRNWIPKTVRAEVYTRDNNICQYCHKTIEPKNLTIEHIIPVSKGGIDDIINYITVCRSCNSSKKDKSLIEFIETRWDIKISELPIHGDIIMDTPELDSEYRRVRQNCFYRMRAEDKLKGSNAFKKLEKEFRSNLWATHYGRVLSKRYPELPGQVRASIPLVEYLVPDSRKPIHKLLIEFCKSSQTRALIDDMIRLVSNSNTTNVDNSIKSILSGHYDEGIQNKIEQAYRRAKIINRDGTIFKIPKEVEDVPVSERDLLDEVIDEVIDEVGIVNVTSNYEIRIPQVVKQQHVEILITKIHPTYSEGVPASLPSSAIDK